MADPTPGVPDEQEYRRLLLHEPVYRVTTSTGIVHRVPCIRMPIDPVATLEWTSRDQLLYPRDRACKHCQPNGFPWEGRA